LDGCSSYALAIGRTAVVLDVDAIIVFITNYNPLGSTLFGQQQVLVFKEKEEWLLGAVQSWCSFALC
jgi:hypothetical protein